MLNTILLVYFGSVSQAATAFCGVFASILFICAIGFYIATECYENYSKELQESNRKKFGKIAKYSLIIALVLSFIGIVLPDKKVCYMAAAVTSADYITHETEVGKTLNDASVTIIKDVSKIVHDLAEKKGTDDEQEQ